ncbi:MAG: phosphotransferase enzyme family protein [Dehalococcoidia bacterium]
MPTHDDYIGLVPDVLGMYGLWPYGDPEPVAGGSLNFNFHTYSDGGEHFLRRYRDNLELPRIMGEHALVKWVAERGIPAPVPESVPEKGTVAVMGGGHWALYPWVEGVVRERGSLTAEQAHLLGSVHGAIQAILAGYPSDPNERPQLTWDKAQSLELLQRLRIVAAERNAEHWMQEHLAAQAAHLESLEVLPPSAFASLPRQVLHGDFHDHQVMWDGDQIVAVVDWEIWRTDSRIWEVIRSLSFSQMLESPRMEDYLAGYRKFVQLGEDEIRLGFKLWWQSRVVGMWAWAENFLAGNERVAKFLPEIASEFKNLQDAAWRSAIEDRFIKAARD